MISDNEKTFKVTSKKLKLLYEHPEVQAFLTEKGITWIFNLEEAPMVGVFNERMVKVVMVKVLTENPGECKAFL